MIDFEEMCDAKDKKVNSSESSEFGDHGVPCEMCTEIPDNGNVGVPSDPQPGSPRGGNFSSSCSDNCNGFYGLSGAKISSKNSDQFKSKSPHVFFSI